MAMTMTGDIQLYANREAVWAKLNDPAVLKSCIPGCEQLDILSDSEFQAVATVKVGCVYRMYGPPPICKWIFTT